MYIYIISICIYMYIHISIHCPFNSWNLFWVPKLTAEVRRAPSLLAASGRTLAFQAVIRGVLWARMPWLRFGRTEQTGNILRHHFENWAPDAIDITDIIDVVNHMNIV